MSGLDMGDARLREAAREAQEKKQKRDEEDEDEANKRPRRSLRTRGQGQVVDK